MGPRIVLALVALAATAAPVSAQDEDAGRLARRATAAYGEERFDEAAVLFAQAYDLAPEPSLLYNLGRAHERAGHADEAIAAYRRFLAESPDAPERSEVELSLGGLAREQALRQRLDEAQVRPTETTTTTSDPVVDSPPDPTALAIGIAIASVGALGMTAGAITGAVAQSRYDRAGIEPGMERAAQLEREAGDLATATTVTLIAGGALLAGGAITSIVGAVVLSSGGSPPRDGARVAIGPGSVSISGHF